MKFPSHAVRKLLPPIASCLVCNLYAAQPSSNTLMKASHSADSAAGNSSSKLSELPPNRFRPIDMFDLETATDPQISPDGAKVVFVRNFNDIMKDRKRSNLWIVDFEGNDLRPLTTGGANDFSPRWSPDGKRLLYASSAEGSVQIYVRWLDTGQTAKVTSVQKSPTSMTWSPDGRWIAFAMLVPEETKPFAEMPAKPEGADWGKPAKVIRKFLYRALNDDLSGYTIRNKSSS